MSHVYVVMARTSDIPGKKTMPNSLGPSGISCFIVPSDVKGISIGKKEAKVGWNSQPTCAVHFDDCRIPLENMLGSEGEGFKIAMRALDGGRVNIASCSLGAGQAALDAAIGYTRERVQFKQPLSAFQVLSCILTLGDTIQACRGCHTTHCSSLDGSQCSSSTRLPIPRCYLLFCHGKEICNRRFIQCLR